MPAARRGRGGASARGPRPRTVALHAAVGLRVDVARVGPPAAPGVRGVDHGDGRGHDARRVGALVRGDAHALLRGPRGPERAGDPCPGDEDEEQEDDERAAALRRVLGHGRLPQRIPQSGGTRPGGVGGSSWIFRYSTIAHRSSGLSGGADDAVLRVVRLRLARHVAGPELVADVRVPRLAGVEPEAVARAPSRRRPRPRGRTPPGSRRSARPARRRGESIWKSVGTEPLWRKGPVAQTPARGRAL